MEKITIVMERWTNLLSGRGDLVRRMERGKGLVLMVLRNVPMGALFAWRIVRRATINAAIRSTMIAMEQSMNLVEWLTITP